MRVEDVADGMVGSKDGTDRKRVGDGDVVDGDMMGCDIGASGM